MKVWIVGKTSQMYETLLVRIESKLVNVLYWHVTNDVQVNSIYRNNTTNSLKVTHFIKGPVNAIPCNAINVEWSMQT